MAKQNCNFVTCGCSSAQEAINQENLALNKKLFESKWTQIRSHTTAWWTLMVEYDLNKVDKAEVKFDKYVTMLQVKYGYTRQEAKMEIGKRVAEIDAELGNNVTPA
jgi:allophanate hydrolase subunit 1